MEVLGFDAPLVVFAAVATTFLLFAGLELAVPFRTLSQSKAQRWTTNLTLFAIDTLAVRLLLPLAMLGTALWAERATFGLFNLVELPAWLAFAAAFLALDLALYLQHWATHRVPVLWRMHRVHHVDRDFDVTTAARFHPFEIVLSMVYKMGVVALLGAPALAMFAFEIAFTMATLFNHSNTRLPAWLEGPVRALIVTPDMHRIHHSAQVPETNSNYGTLFSFWDRLFGTYVPQADRPQRAMIIGLNHWQDDAPAKLGWSLWLPFLPNTRERE